MSHPIPSAGKVYTNPTKLTVSPASREPTGIAMKTKNILIRAALAALVCCLMTTPAGLMGQSSIPCTDTNTVKWLASPQVDGGLDIKDSRQMIVLADDFPCSSTGPISDIHIWGSWLSDTQGLITNFWLGIY